MADAYILDAVRTPRGRGKAGKGALSGIHPQELLAQTLNVLAGARRPRSEPRSTTWSSVASRRPASKARTSRATPCSRPAGRSRSAP